jgi:hypothetical protein
MATNHQTGSETPRIPQGALQGETPAQAEANYQRVNLRGKRAETAAKPSAGRNPKLNGKVDVSFSTCAKTITNVNISRRGLLALEMSVGLAVFVDYGAANRAAKQMLMDVYAKAGYECQNHEGKDYKTVRRRIDASAGLYGKLTGEVIAKWMDGKKENKLLQAVAHEISKLGFNSMDDVLDFIGRASNRTNQRTAVSDAGPNPYDIEVGDGKIVHIPRSLSEAELIELAQKLLVLADEVKIRETQPERRISTVKVDHDRRNGGNHLH